MDLDKLTSRERSIYWDGYRTGRDESVRVAGGTAAARTSKLKFPEVTKITPGCRPKMIAREKATKPFVTAFYNYWNFRGYRAHCVPFDVNHVMAWVEG